MKHDWKICGVPLNQKQISAIEAAKADGKRRIVIETTAAQSIAIKKAATEADEELKQIAEEYRNRPAYAVTMRRRRKELTMSLDALADATGIDKANLSRTEWGRTNPTLETLQRIGEALQSELHVDFVEAVG